MYLLLFEMIIKKYFIRQSNMKEKKIQWSLDSKVSNSMPSLLNSLYPLTFSLLLVDWWHIEGGQPAQSGIFWTQLHTDLPGLGVSEEQVFVRYSLKYQTIYFLFHANETVKPLTLKPRGDGSVIVLHLFLLRIGQSLNYAIWRQS